MSSQTNVEHVFSNTSHLSTTSSMLVMYIVAKFSLVEQWTKWGSVLHDSYLNHLKVEP